METIRILGTGSYLPPAVLTNFDLEKSGLNTTHDWIVQRTGVSERRIAGAGVTTSDLGHQAGLRALEAAGMSAQELDLIIVATITPDTCCPSAANWLQANGAVSRVHELRQEGSEEQESFWIQGFHDDALYEYGRQRSSVDLLNSAARARVGAEDLNAEVDKIHSPERLDRCVCARRIGINRIQASSRGKCVNHSAGGKSGFFIGSTSFCAGTDSPVSAASSALKFRA